MTDRGVVLEADGLGRTFGGNQVLKAASFQARRGTVTALMGRNGTGKTTMLRIAVGLVRPDFGRVLFHGTYLARPRLATMAAQGLFYSAQGSALTHLFTLRQQIEAVASVYGGSSRQGEVVRSMQLTELLDQTPSTLSGGEQQRAALTLALVRRPICLLMDEPFSGVAPKDRPLIARGLLELRTRGCGVVVTGHDVEDLFAVADEVVWVTAGTSHWLGSPSEAAAHHQFRREYLGPRGGPPVATP